ncbi:SMI1/KNR4 family protein [Yinghuangia soli]|uniref:SMI1/KNR4 family protein n=1 Tax=Yinghuangia soli TaxID=2908204 RepID=A0AA41Q728_9ACTN|nr:SMI1/KNR4 family protein [Yinghuangia soli]MCF2532130.1 SMI1/KNR4 family protein [Yinghuangia soli]
MSSLYDLAAWEPVLRIIRANNPNRLTGPRGYVSGRISPESTSLPAEEEFRPPASEQAIEADAVGRILGLLGEVGADGISYRVTIAADGRTVMRLSNPSPAVEHGLGPYPGALVLVEGAVPEPWRRLPEPRPDAGPSSSVDLELLERTLRERVPDAIGATDAEVAAAEARLGVPLPDELKVLYQVTRARWQDLAHDDDADERMSQAVCCELFPLDELYIADPSSRPDHWQFGAKDAVVTPPDAAVQGLVGSPGWIAFADNGGGDRFAVDLTPGPRGHVGQIILIDHELSVGADLVAASLTDMIVHRRNRADRRPEADSDAMPVVAHVNSGNIRSIEAAVHDGLEVLSIGHWDGAPFHLIAAHGLPRLRTLYATPGTLADPLEVAELTGLEFLALGPDDWRLLLDASAVPKGLSAAEVIVFGQPDPGPITALANEILGLWGRPAIIDAVLEGRISAAE